MPLPLWVKIVAVAFGAAFFVAHVLLAVHGMRCALTRDQRVEAAGALVPGVSGLLIAFAVASPWPWLGFAASALAAVTIVLGRALYEMIVFRDGAP
jgi:hypothetical protein